MCAVGKNYVGLGSFWNFFFFESLGFPFIDLFEQKNSSLQDALVF